jgi:hypothetical protein
MAPTIRRDIERDIGGDHQRIHAADTRYGEIRFKHILLPVWMSAFRFRAQVYRFVVNGCTGEVQGERPYSPWKIALAVLLVALLIGGGLAVWQHYSETLNSVPGPTPRIYYGELPDRGDIGSPRRGSRRQSATQVGQSGRAGVCFTVAPSGRALPNPGRHYPKLPYWVF